MIHLIGEIAAVLTAACWSFNSVVFTIAGKRVGSSSVNALRIWIALLFQIAIHLFLFQSLFPFELGSRKVLLLALSGVIGLVVGDACLFEAYLLIGPRLAMLMMLTAPIFSAILAWIFLGEVLSLLEIGAIMITVVGIGWVVSEIHNSKENRPKKYLIGIVLGLAGGMGQAVGLLLSKVGMDGGVSPISANHVRIIFAALTLLIINIFRKTLVSRIRQLKNYRIALALVSGALAGPVIGVILSLVAIVHTHIGVASTLMSISPVLLIPVSHYLFKEKITWRAVIGTLVALFGACLLFFV